MGGFSKTITIFFSLLVEQPIKIGGKIEIKSAVLITVDNFINKIIV